MALEKLHTTFFVAMFVVLLVCNSRLRSEELFKKELYLPPIFFILFIVEKIFSRGLRWLKFKYFLLIFAVFIFLFDSI